MAVEVWWVVACGSQWWRVRACCHVHHAGSLRGRWATVYGVNDGLSPLVCGM